MRLPWGRYLNLAQAWILDGATAESRETFMASLWEQHRLGQVKAEREELREQAKEEGRELTTREKLLLARPDWNPEQATMKSMAAVATMMTAKTKAQQQARVTEERRVAGEESVAEGGELE